MPVSCSAQLNGRVVCLRAQVYRGSWNGNTVAVKVMETAEDAGDPPEDGDLLARSGVFEAVLSSNLSHPNIVHT